MSHTDCLDTKKTNMASKNTLQVFRHTFGLTMAILLFHKCGVASSDNPETSMLLQFSHRNTDEPEHHMRQRRADTYTQLFLEIEINATDVSVINMLKSYLERANNSFTIGGVTLYDATFTTVCSLGGTGYQCTCEDQYAWPCNKCSAYGSCGARNDTCSCINTFIPGQYCQPVSKLPEDISCLNAQADTTTTTTPSTSQTIPTAPAVLSPSEYGTVISFSLRINQSFDTRLTKPNDSHYQEKRGHIKSAIDQGYRTLSNFKEGSANVIGFRSGSIIADYNINVTDNNLNLTSANKQVSENLLRLGISLAENAFEESVEKNLTTKVKYYPQQSMELRCTKTYNGTITWKVNGKDPVGNFTFTNDDYGSTLIVNNVSESDTGRYSCIIARDPIPYVQWQNVVIMPHPNIIPDQSEITLPCENPAVSLRCCAKGYPIEWDQIPNGAINTSDTEPGCIKLQNNNLSIPCGSNKTFICRLQNMKELETFNYYSSTIRVQTIKEYDCNNETLGAGKMGDTVQGPCEKGMEGRITYECKPINSKNEWISTNRECVVKVIKDLEREAEVLLVEQIPTFVADLNIATQNYTAQISQSPETVQTIVEMLVKVAIISQTVTIDKDVMKDFLKTVDIIVSDNTFTSWQTLNNNVTTVNTSTDLLRAIETISDRLFGVEFTIKESSIYLIRATKTNTFIETSQLPNSMTQTQVTIPNIVKPTLITVIFLNKLDQILPTRNTSNNDSRTSENRINGDVVVVKVNETMNNISFAFDIKNTSLGNPQCVFWNFTLDRWDSTGCKVKSAGNDSVTCECNHTTSFSILMSPVAAVGITTEKRLALDYITYIGVAISMISLILCLIIEIIVWKQVTRNDTSYMRHVSIVNIAVSLLIANICFIIGAGIAYPYENLQQTVPVERCSPVVFFMHFFYLAVFFWMLISALLLLYRTVVVLVQMSRAKMMFIAFTVGYCAPLLIAVITVASTAGPKNYVSKENACWLNWNESRALLAFVIPAFIIVFINLFILIVVVCKILRRGVGTSAQPSERHILIVIARCVAFLTPIFGLTWGFGIGTMVSTDFGIHVVFAFLNSLQGFFVLLFGILLDGKVREALARTLSLTNLSSIVTRSTNGGTPSSSGPGIFERLRRNVYNISNPSAARSANSSGASESLNP